MKILVSGSTGLVGKNLIPKLQDRGYEVETIGREDFKQDISLLTSRIHEAGIVIHLAGAPIVARWTSAYKKEILASRVDTTKMIVEAIAAAENKPQLFISTSAVGIYPDGKTFTESDAEFSDNFLGQVCSAWEAEALNARSFTKVAICRLGVVLAKDGGALPKMLPSFRLGMGGPVAGGQQGFSWIHLSDLIDAYLFIIDKHLEGTFNLTAPGVTDNYGFTKVLAQILQRPAIVPVPSFALKLAFGEGAVTLTSGQKALPGHLLNEGFKFKFPDLKAALEDILQK